MESTVVAQETLHRLFPENCEDERTTQKAEIITELLPAVPHDETFSDEVSLLNVNSTIILQYLVI